MKTVLITGANRGIGLEFTKQYLAEGNRVFATARDPAAAHDLLKLQEINKEMLTVLPLDVTDPQSRKQLSKSLGDQIIHLLINNAGYYGEGNQLTQLDEQEWLKVFHINSIAPIKLVQVLRSNLANSGSSTVAMLSSKMGSVTDNTSGGSYIYRSSKAALNAAAKSLAVDLAEEKIKVVILHPGWVQTDMGGANALIDTTTSVKGLRKVIGNLKANQSGDFIAYDGTLIPW